MDILYFLMVQQTQILRQQNYQNQTRLKIIGTAINSIIFHHQLLKQNLSHNPKQLVQ